jgi:parvulin-like peptidyl-prolyl isomerase
MRNTPPPPPRRVRSAHESRSATVRAAAAAPSRRQQSKWQREQSRERSLYIAIGALLGVIALIFAGGLLYDNLVRANAVVAQIGTETITAAQLVDEMQPAIRGIQAQVKQAGPGANTSQYVESQKRDLPDQTLNDLIDTRLISQEATRRGLAVTPTELDDKQRQTVADFQAATNPSPTAVPTSAPEGAPTSVPTPPPTPDLNVTPTALPTLEPSAYDAALKDLLDRNGLTDTDLRNRLQENMLREKLTTAIGEEQVQPIQEQLHARHILVATQDQAQDVLNQLQGGADFAQLAQQVSTDPGSKAKGGDLGWFGRGVMNKPFEDAAFALQPGQLSPVVQSPNGFHVIQLLERDPARAVPADQLQQQRDKAFSDWLASRRSSADVKLELTQPERDWVLGRIGVRP